MIELNAHCAGIGPKRIRNRRFSRPFFSILPIWISPTSPVDLTCVPPQGWLSTAALSPMQTSRICPVPDRRPHILRLHQARIGGKLLVGDPAREHRMIGADQFHQPLPSRPPW